MSGTSTYVLDRAVCSVIESIHASPLQCVLCVAGAGSSAISALTAVPNCSHTLLEAHIPYAVSSTAALLDDSPSSMVTASVARQLAQHAYHCARRHAARTPREADEALVGIGATSAIRGDRTRRGRDRAFVAAWHAARVVEYAMELSSHRSRDAQEREVAWLVLSALADSAGVPFVQPSPFSVPPSRRCFAMGEMALVSRVLCGALPMVLFNAHGEMRAAVEPYAMETLPPFCARHDSNGSSSATRLGCAASVMESTPHRVCLLFPGSFRPLHWGHTELARAATQAVRCATQSELEGRVTYEIAVRNADKGSVRTEAELERRIRQFTERGERVAVTGATLFTEKAALFPGYGFIIGVDTAKRVLDPKYYGDSMEAMTRAVQGIGERGGYFVVGGRTSGEKGEWEDLSSLHIPEALRSLFISIPRDAFRVDVSSTELRQQGNEW